MTGEPGALALCSSTTLADETAQRVVEATIRTIPGREPLGLVVHHGIPSGLSMVRATGPIPPLVDAMRSGADAGLYETAARHLIRHRRTWPQGELSPGVSSIFLTKARPGMSAADYHRYWELEHGPRALRHHLGMWDYTQISVLRTHRGEPFDGVAVTQWAREEELRDRFTDSPFGADVIRRDAARFTDLRDLRRHLMTERILLDEPATGEELTVTDARQLEVGIPAERLWGRIGDLGVLSDWSPSGLTERLIDHQPDERMLQLSIDEGGAPGILSYTSRYEVRAVDAARCRLDWYPRARVNRAGSVAFATLVDRSWPRISGGLSAGW